MMCASSYRSSSELSLIDESVEGRREKREYREFRGDLGIIICLVLIQP
jgi:hypothetical protein